jgi:hypothetical protein
MACGQDTHLRKCGKECVVIDKTKLILITLIHYVLLVGFSRRTLLHGVSK